MNTSKTPNGDVAGVRSAGPVRRICQAPEIGDVLEDDNNDQWIIATNMTKRIAEMAIADGATFFMPSNAMLTRSAAPHKP